MWITKPDRVKKDFYFLGTCNNPVYLIKKRGEWILIEGGMSWMKDLIVSQLKEIVKDFSAISTWLITHAHYDHVGLVPELLPLLPNATVYASKEAISNLNTPRELALINKFNKLVCAKHEVTGQDLSFEKVVINEHNLNQLEYLGFQVVKTPGHSNCQVAYYDQDYKTLFVSDALGELIEPDYFFPLPFYNLNNYLNSISLLQIYYPEIIGFGHNGVLKDLKARNSFLHAESACLRVAESIFDDLTTGLGEEEIASKFFDKYSPHSRDYVPENLHLKSMNRIVNVLTNHDILKRKI